MKKIIIILPCYNEEKTIGKVVDDFKKQLPDAEIIVYDNNSTDHSIEIARSKNVTIFLEEKQGKGNVIRTAFNKLEADYYIMVDADDTYPAEEVKKLLKPVINREADMVVGTRLENANNKAFKQLHRFGNQLFLFILNKAFKVKLKDILSGFRVMNREFVKGIPLLSEGFEIETELTLQALERNFQIKEIPISYRERPSGSESKISAFRDGFKIISTIISIFRDYRPMIFFFSLSSILFILGLIAGIIVTTGYFKTGLVTRIPLAILSTLLIILSIISLITGFIVSTINRRFREMQILLKKQLNDDRKK